MRQSMQTIASIMSLLEQNQLLDGFILAGGKMNHSDDAAAMSQLVQMILQHPDFEMFLYMIRQGYDVATEQTGMVADESILDVYINQYIDIYEHMKAGEILKYTGHPQFKIMHSVLKLL